MFNQPLHAIRSKAARQKFLRKKVKKANRDEVRGESIDFILFVLQNNEVLSLSHSVCDSVIRDIADRVVAGTPKPDVDNF